jgi:DNA-binding response OmpR family regulator
VATSKILVADDEDSYRKSIAVRLRATGEFDVDEADSGKEAIGCIKRKQYDLLILDHQMGEVSGLNVMQWMCEEKIVIPVVLLTGAGNETIAVEVMKLGACDYLRKDQLDLSRLPIIIRAALEQRKERSPEARKSIPANTPETIPTPSEFMQELNESFLQSSTTAFDLIGDEFAEYRERVRPKLVRSVRPDLDRVMESIQDQLRIIFLLSKTIADLAILVQQEHRQDPRLGRNTDPEKEEIN